MKNPDREAKKLQYIAEQVAKVCEVYGIKATTKQFDNVVEIINNNSDVSSALWLKRMFEKMLAGGLSYKPEIFAILQVFRKWQDDGLIVRPRSKNNPIAKIHYHGND